MQLRWSIFRVVFDRHRFFAFLVITGAFTFLGPFGTYQAFELPMRLAYWTACNAGVAFCMSLSADSLFAPGVAEFMSRPIKAILSSALGALGGTLVVWLAEVRLRDASADPFYIWFCVFVVCVVMITLRLQLWVPPPRTYAKFFKRLPPELGTDLICLSMADHYIEARTAAGTEMIHLRFADALKELGDFPGTQIHRSHWVATAHAQYLQRHGRHHRLVLSNGDKLPVSKSHIAAVRALLAKNQAQRLDQIGQAQPATVPLPERPL